MNKFKEYVIRELGLDEISDEALNELHEALGNDLIEKLYSKEYRLLSEDNFEEYYGLASDLLIKYIDCVNWFGIVVYKNIYR